MWIDVSYLVHIYWKYIMQLLYIMHYRSCQPLQLSIFTVVNLCNCQSSQLSIFAAVDFCSCQPSQLSIFAAVSYCSWNNSVTNYVLYFLQAPERLAFIDIKLPAATAIFSCDSLISFLFCKRQKGWLSLDIKLPPAMFSNIQLWQLSFLFCRQQKGWLLLTSGVLLL